MAVCIEAFDSRREVQFSRALETCAGRRVVPERLVEDPQVEEGAVASYARHTLVVPWVGLAQREAVLEAELDVGEARRVVELEQRQTV